MQRLQRLTVWQSAHRLAAVSYRITMRSPLQRHFSLSDQIRRAATSVPANLAEGYGLGTTAQMIRCTRIALGSSYELRVHLALVRELGLADADIVDPVIALAEETSRMLIGMLKGLQRR